LATSSWSPSSTGSAGSLEHLLKVSKDLQERGVDLVVLDQGIDTSTAVGRMFFHILGAIAEFEHALMSERTRDGLAAARTRGRTGGPKPKLTPRQARMAREIARRACTAGSAVASRSRRASTWRLTAARVGPAVVEVTPDTQPLVFPRAHQAFAGRCRSW
jgi:DNA invertase Pin-like site-specific DNA recombinase